MGCKFSIATFILTVLFLVSTGSPLANAAAPAPGGGVSIDNVSIAGADGGGVGIVQGHTFTIEVTVTNHGSRARDVFVSAVPPLYTAIIDTDVDSRLTQLEAGETRTFTIPMKVMNSPLRGFFYTMGDASSGGTYLFDLSTSGADATLYVKPTAGGAFTSIAQYATAIGYGGAITGFSMTLAKTMVQENKPLAYAIYSDAGGSSYSEVKVAAGPGVVPIPITSANEQASTLTQDVAGYYMPLFGPVGEGLSFALFYRGLEETGLDFVNAEYDYILSLMDRWQQEAEDSETQIVLTTITARSEGNSIRYFARIRNAGMPITDALVCPQTATDEYDCVRTRRLAPGEADINTFTIAAPDSSADIRPVLSYVDSSCRVRNVVLGINTANVQLRKHNPNIIDQIGCGLFGWLGWSCTEPANIESPPENATMPAFLASRSPPPDCSPVVPEPTPSPTPEPSISISAPDMVRCRQEGLGDVFYCWYPPPTEYKPNVPQIGYDVAAETDVANLMYDLECNDGGENFTTTRDEVTTGDLVLGTGTVTRGGDTTIYASLEDEHGEYYSVLPLLRQGERVHFEMDVHAESLPKHLNCTVAFLSSGNVVLEVKRAKIDIVEGETG